MGKFKQEQLNMGKKPIKKLLRASLDLFDARHTGVLYGTNQSKIKYLPSSTWDRGIIDGFYGRGLRGLVLKLFGTYIVTAKQMSPVFFYTKSQTGSMIDSPGFIAYILRNCADYYKKGISVIICPETLNLAQKKDGDYFEIPFYVYNGKCIVKSLEMIRADARIVRYFNSNNSIFVYLPDYGVLVINTAKASLLERCNERFVQEKQLLDRMDLLCKMVDMASLENLGLLRGNKGAQLLWHKEKHLRKVSRELIYNEKNYRDLYQTAPIAYITMDINGIISNCNEQTQYLSGYDRDDLIGHNVDLFLSQKSQRDMIAADIMDLLLKGKSVKQMELLMKPKNGESFWASLSIDGVRDRYDKIVELRATIMDIAERKNLEKQLFKAHKMEAIGRLSGGIAHDFNNILSPISGYAEMLLIDTPKDHPLHGHLNIIQDCVNHAKDLVSQMLTFSQQKEQVLKPIDLSKTLAESMILVRSSLPSSIKLKVTLDDQDTIIMADSIQIHQVIMNLVSNAYKAIGKRNGTLIIQLSKVKKPELFFNQSTLESKNYVCLSIEDDGESLDPEICDKLFDPYFSIDKQNREFGIGLSVVYGIIESHHGRIRVESLKDRGNRFDVFFPICDQYGADDIDPYVHAGRIDDDFIRTGTEKILLVDDDKNVIDMQTYMFEKLGYTVHCFLEPVKAIEYLRTHSKALDLVITDLTMSGLTGIELANHIALIRPDLPVIICSGQEEMIQKNKLDSPSIKGFLKKPISIKTVSEVLVRVLDQPN
ncbi:MAG: PAS domain S-box protein [Pseudomonadota bacterium]